eukprot:220048_1
MALHRIINTAKRCFVASITNALKRSSHIKIIEKSRNLMTQNSFNTLDCLKTMKHYRNIGEVHAAKKFINDLIEHDCQYISLQIYNELFNLFADKDCIWESEFYIDSMINIHGIMPNIDTATILIKGCQRIGNIKFAEKIWKQMIVNYHLKPNINVFSEMMGVYGKTGKDKSAEKLLKQMIERHQIKPNIVICSHLMKAYAENKNIYQVLQMKKYIESKMHIKLTHIQYLIIMTCYLKNDDYHNAIKMFNEYVNVTKDNPPNIKLFALKMVSYLGIMKMECDQEKREYYFNLITDSIELKGKYLNVSLANIQLSAAIGFYGNDFDKILSVFNKLRSKDMFRYWTDDYLSIDLHGYGYDIVGFLLKYIFEYEKERILDMDCVQILCGRGTHRDVTSASLGNANCRGIQEYTTRELMGYSPPIRCDVHKGFLILNRDDILKYYS